jgi:hypothetical protein
MPPSQARARTDIAPLGPSRIGLIGRSPKRLVYMALSPKSGGEANWRRAALNLARNFFPFQPFVHCKRIEGGQLGETDQCVRSLLVLFATLQRSSIRKRVKRIASCAAAAEPLSQRATNSVVLLNNRQRCRPADARQVVTRDASLARQNAASVHHRWRQMLHIRRTTQVCRRPIPSDNGKRDFRKPDNSTRLPG